MFAQAACNSTSSNRLRVEDQAGAELLRVAVDCTGGGTVEADWVGAVTIDQTIKIGEGTFLNVTGEDELAEVRGGLLTRMFEVTTLGGLSLTQLTLSGGNDTSGGAIRSTGGTVTLERCVFDGNIATDGNGGAVLAKGGNLTIVGGEFSNNNTTGKGGAVGVEEDGLLVVERDTLFGGNYAESAGGALYGASDAKITIDGCTFKNNFTPGSGGGIAASSATIGGGTLLTENSAGKDGGGVRDQVVAISSVGALGAARTL